MATDLTNIGIDSTRLRKARKRVGLSQSEAAAAVGVQKAAISKMELGKALPSADVLARLCRLYQLEIADLSRRAA